MFINSSNPRGWKTISSYIKQRQLNPQSPVWFWSNQQLTTFCENPENHWQAKLDKSNIMAILLFRQTIETAEIYFLETHAQFLRQGHMSDLFKEFALKLNKEIWVDVHAANQGAVDFYYRHGFKLVGERKAYYRDGGDCLLMTYSV